MFAISAVTGLGLPQLIHRINDLLATLPPTLDELPDSLPPEAVAETVMPAEPSPAPSGTDAANPP